MTSAVELQIDLLNERLERIRARAHELRQTHANSRIDHVRLHLDEARARLTLLHHAPRERFIQSLDDLHHAWESLKQSVRALTRGKP